MDGAEDALQRGARPPAALDRIGAGGDGLLAAGRVGSEGRPEPPDSRDAWVWRLEPGRRLSRPLSHQSRRIARLDRDRRRGRRPRAQREDSCFLPKEQSWRTAWRARSLLSRTTRSSRLATGTRSRRTGAERELDSEGGAAPFASTR